MKVFAFIMVLGMFALLTGCGTTAAPSAGSSNATELGDSGIHASGTIESGGTLHAR